MLRLLLWSIIWVNSTGINDRHPLVLFPDHLNNYPYLSNRYAKSNNIADVYIYTSVKFPERPIYKLSQYHKLHYDRAGKLLNRQIIFEALTDTLNTIISWSGGNNPTAYLENTGRQWEYSTLEWQDGYPSKINYVNYYDRDATAMDALQVVGEPYESAAYWSRNERSGRLEFVLHEKLGTPLGQLQIEPYFKPEQFYYNSNMERQSFRYRYKHDDAGRIEQILHGGRLTQLRHELAYDEQGRIKAVKSYENNMLEVLTDYFYNENGTLRSFLITNVRTKEMTIKELRYSFY